jgi:molecular chaperone GrpE (heat shock protein)
MYEDLFPIDDIPQPLLDPESGDILGRCYEWAPKGEEREDLLRRNRRLRFQRIGNETEKILTKLIPVADGMERILEMGENAPEVERSEVLQNWLKAMEALHKRLRNVMAREGMEGIDSVGKPLDLDLHEVIEVRGEAEEGREIVVEEREKAYVYDNRVVRDAKVVVERVPGNDRSLSELHQKGTKEG